MTLDKGSRAGFPEVEEARRSLLSRFTSGVFAGLVAPAVFGDLTSAQAAPSAQAGELVPILDLPEPVEGEHQLVRMMEDLRRALQKPMDQRKWAMVIDLRKCTGCKGCTIACIIENKLPPGTYLMFR